MRACPNCGEDNPDHAKFCLSCATPLAEPAGRPREVRKTVTIVFSDVSGSTALGERLDPETLRRVMTRYFDELRAALEGHGGTVEKFIGDAVMAVFGIPQLHEDDALRAVRAAAEIRERLDSLNQALERERGVSIAARIGVNTGVVVAGDPGSGQAFVTGDAVNVAARLEQAAQSGEILIGESTHHLVRDAVRVQAVDPLTLKGKGEAVKAFRLLEVLPVPAGHARRIASPMVGRARERRRLEDAFEQAGSDRTSQLFTVLGSAGVGKSRLVEEFVQANRAEATVLRGRCLSYGQGITFWPVIEVVNEAAGVDEEDSPTDVQRKIASLVDDEENALLVAEQVMGVIGLAEPTVGTDEGFWAVRKLLEAVARRRSLILVFDDIHWAEPNFLDLVEHVADWSRDAPILILCMARPELLDARPAWAGGKLNATSVLLEPLSEEECERLVDNLLGRAALAPPARLHITEAAEGNPLFVEEMLSMLIDDGVLERRNGHWAPTSDLSAVKVPPTIQALLAARLDRLAIDERTVIERASVEGSVFHQGAVVELAEEALRAQIRAHVGTLVRKELIRPDRAAFAGEEAFRFRHLLIRDAAYESLPKELRADLHERFAAWLERKAADRTVEYEEITAYHLEQAYSYRAELGPVDEHGRELAQKAGERLASAGRRAMAREDMPAAAKLLERTTELLPADGDTRLALLTELGEALRECGEFARAAAVLEESIERAGARGKADVEWRARLELAFTRVQTHPQGAITEGLWTAERAGKIFEQLADEAGLAKALYFTGVYHFWLGHHGPARDSLERARNRARNVGHQWLEALIDGFIGAVVFHGRTSVEEGFEHFQAALKRAEAGGTRMTQANALQNLARLSALVGRFDEARELVAQMEAIFQELGRATVDSAMAIGETLGLIELQAGDPVAAERALRRAYEFLHKAGEKGYLSTTAGELASALYEQSRFDEAEQFAQISFEAAGSDDVSSQAVWRGVRAKVLARRGEFAEAKRLAREAVEIAGETDLILVHAGAVMALAHVLRVEENADEAAAVIRQAIDLYDSKGDTVSAAKAHALLGEFSH